MFLDLKTILMSLQNTNYSQPHSQKHLLDLVYVWSTAQMKTAGFGLCVVNSTDERIYWVWFMCGQQHRRKDLLDLVHEYQQHR